MSDDFFDKIDASLNKQQKVKDAETATADKNAAFVEALIPRLAQIAQTYAGKCKERGMDVTVKAHSRSITFSMRYRSGNERSLVGGSDYAHQNKLSFEGHFPNDDGRRYKTAPSNWYDESDWKDEIFENQLKKLIEDHVFYANRFGGIT